MELIVIKGKQASVTLNLELTRHVAPEHELVIALADSYNLSSVEERKHTEDCWEKD